jgi:uncharacterized protein (DUF1778 family)
MPVPEKPYSIHLRFTEEDRQAIHDAAKAERRSDTNWVTWVIAQRLADLRIEVPGDQSR